MLVANAAFFLFVWFGICFLVLGIYSWDKETPKLVLFGVFFIVFGFTVRTLGHQIFG